MTAIDHQGIAPHSTPLRHKASAFLLVFILAAGPGAWLGQLVISYLLTTHACYPHVLPEILPMTRWLSPVLAVIIGTALAVSVAALMAAFHLWDETRNDTRDDGRQTLTFGAGATRFMALVGVIVSSLFSVACLFALLAYFLVPLCA